jgi:glycosyltransferase involved in cell wall biosynthesis
MGGGEINLFLLAKALVQEGTEVTILTSKQDAPNYERVEGIEIYRCFDTAKSASTLLANLQRSSLTGKIAQQANKLIKKHKFHLVHFIGSMVTVAPYINIPKFATIESFPALCPKGDRIYHGQSECQIVCNYSEFATCQKQSKEVGKMTNRWYLKYNPLASRYIYSHYHAMNQGMKACNLVAISRYVANLLAAQGKSSALIPNALDLDSYVLPGKDNNKPVILYLGSLTHFKGPKVLLEAMQGLNCTLQLYGKGNRHEELQNFINKHNLDAEIHDPVPYAQIPQLYAQADIIVFPSIWPEPFGRIPIEAAAAGKPIIASNIGAIRETVADNGILVTPGDTNELRSALNKLINDPTLRKEMGHKGIVLAQQYHQTMIAKKMIKYYEDVV